jgi:hypothetical protein
MRSVKRSILAREFTAVGRTWVELAEDGTVVEHTHRSMAGTPDPPRAVGPQP